MDFSENLTIPVSKEPQSLHWVNHQLTVHSGIIKHNGTKTYVAYFSNDLTHDQTFVDTALFNSIQFNFIFSHKKSYI